MAVSGLPVISPACELFARPWRWLIAELPAKFQSLHHTHLRRRWRASAEYPLTWPWTLTKVRWLAVFPLVFQNPVDNPLVILIINPPIRSLRSGDSASCTAMLIAKLLAVLTSLSPLEKKKLAKKFSPRRALSPGIRTGYSGLSSACSAA